MDKLLDSFFFFFNLNATFWGEGKKIVSDSFRWYTKSFLRLLHIMCLCIPSLLIEQLLCVTCSSDLFVKME